MCPLQSMRKAKSEGMLRKSESMLLVLPGTGFRVYGVPALVWHLQRLEHPNREEAKSDLPQWYLLLDYKSLCNPGNCKLQSKFLLLCLKISEFRICCSETLSWKNCAVDLMTNAILFLREVEVFTQEALQCLQRQIEIVISSYKDKSVVQSIVWSIIPQKNYISVHFSCNLLCRSLWM